MLEQSLTFRGIEATPAMRDAADKFLSKLEQFAPDLMGCDLVVSQPHQHKRKGEDYVLRLSLHTRHADLIVHTKPSAKADHTDFYVALRDCARAARRCLEDHARRLQRNVKADLRPPHAVVTVLEKEQGFGFLSTADGREIYFHRNSVLNRGFAKLKIGSEVRYTEEEGEEGPQASSLRLVGREGRHEFQPNGAQAANGRRL